MFKSVLGIVFKDNLIFKNIFYIKLKYKIMFFVYQEKRKSEIEELEF